MSVTFCTYAHVVPGVAPDPVDQVEGDHRGGVAEVGRVVRRDAADVHRPARRPGCAGRCTPRPGRVVERERDGGVAVRAGRAGQARSRRPCPQPYAGAFGQGRKPVRSAARARRPVLGAARGNTPGRRAAGRPGRRWRPISSAASEVAQPAPSGPRRGRRGRWRSVGQLVRRHRRGRPSPTARCAACPRRGSRRRGRPRTGARRPACSTWPPLRSALLITTSNSAIRASAGVVGVGQQVRPAVVVLGRGDASASPSAARRPARSRPAARPRPARRSRAGRRPRRAARRAAPSAAPRPSRSPPTPRRRRPPARPGCRPGSPTAAARRGSACRRSGRVTPSRVTTARSVVLDASTSRPSSSMLAVGRAAAAASLGRRQSASVAGPHADTARYRW